MKPRVSIVDHFSLTDLMTFLLSLHTVVIVGQHLFTGTLKLSSVI